MIILMLAVPEKPYALDINGLQPLAPNGVFSTFSAESLHKNKYSLEISGEKSGEPDFYRFSLKAAYGLSDKLEFNLTAPYVYLSGSETNGLGDIAVGLKYRFYDEGMYGPSLAFIVDASIPTGESNINTEGGVGAGLIVSKRIGPFDGHLNIFYEHPGDSALNKEISLLGGVEFSAAHNFKILSEILVRKGYDTNKFDQIEARFGYRIKTTDYIYTTFGGGLNLNNKSPEYRLFFSVNFTSPYEKKRLKKLIEEEQ